MADVRDFYLCLKKNGIDFITGVPCAALKKIFSLIFADEEMTYFQTVREEDAIGIATGAYFSGRNPLVLMQNSGLANCINAIASLCMPYKVPLLFLVTWRGCPEDKREPDYHHVMGRSTISLMNELGACVRVLTRDKPEFILSELLVEIKRKRVPGIMLLKRKGVLE